jgi:puromycin-sensitive aminopeptidase
LNKNTVGYYRTNYSSELLDKLVDAIKDKEQLLHATDRLGLQNDIFSLSQSGGGLVSGESVLSFIQNYSQNEENLTVWRDILTNIEKMSILLRNTETHEEFKRYIRDLVKPISLKLGTKPIDGECDLKSMLRALIFRTLGLNGDTHTIQMATQQFNDHFNSIKEIPADMRSAVYSVYLSNNITINSLNEFICHHNSATLQEEKMRMACAMGCVNNKELIEKVLNFSLSDSVRSQDSISIICAVSSSTTCQESSQLAWNFFKANWPLINERYGSGMLITRLVKTVVSNFTNQQQYDDVFDFFKRNECPTAERSIQQGLESIKINQNYLNNEIKSIKSYLKSN